MTKPELQACPFCGGEPIVQDRIRPYWYVECINDKCHVNPSGNHQASKAEAIAAWNTRPDVVSISKKHARALIGHEYDFVFDEALEAITRQLEHIGEASEKVEKCETCKGIGATTYYSGDPKNPMALQTCTACRGTGKKEEGK